MIKYKLKHSYIAFVDLSERKVLLKETSAILKKKYLGGRGFTSRALFELRNKKVDTAWSPENVVCISSGMLSGSGFPTAGRTTVAVLKSPVTGSFCDGNLGGYFGSGLKMCGVDLLVVTGSSELPTIIEIIPATSEIPPRIVLVPISNKLFRSSTSVVTTKYKERGYKILCIGTAGANEVFCATVSCDGRTAGGGGIGGVFGSKKLKGIAVPAFKQITLSAKYQATFNSEIKMVEEKIRSHPVYNTFSRYGTLGLVDIHSGMDYMPHNNFTKTNDKRWPNLSAAKVKKFLIGSKTEKDYDNLIKEKSKLEEFGCNSCPVDCGNFGKLEYEHLFNLGTKLGIYSIKDIYKLSRYCNEVGLDVIQSTSIISTLIQILSDEYIVPVSSYYNKNSIEWGSVKKVRNFLIKLSTGKYNFGYEFKDGLAQGLLNCGFPDWTVDVLMEEYFVSVKNMALSGVVPSEEQRGVALAVATSSRGADHLRSLPTLATYAKWYFSSSWFRNFKKLLGLGLRSFGVIKGDSRFLFGNLYKDYINIFDVPEPIVEKWKRNNFPFDDSSPSCWADMIKFCQEMYAVVDSVSTCRFSSPWRFGIGPTYLTAGIYYLTGIELTWQELLKVGERINAMERTMSVRSRKDDFLPKRFIENWESDFSQLLSEYYIACGYSSKTGKPYDFTLTELGLMEENDDEIICSWTDKSTGQNKTNVPFGSPILR